MGAFIQTVLVNEILIDKKLVIKGETTLDKILDELKKEVHIDLYNITEHTDCYKLKAKEELLTKENLLQFLKEQYQFMKEEQSEEIITKLSSLEPIEEILEFASRKPFQSFQETTIMDYIRVGWDRILLNYNGIILLYEGKAFLECYSTLFNYIETLIQKSSSSELSKLVKVFVD